MNLKKGILLIGILALVIIGFFLMINKDGSSEHVVTVNGEKVSVQEFNFMLDVIKTGMKQEGINNFDTVIDGKKASQVAKEKAIKSIVNYKIGAQKAQKMGIELKAQEVENIDKQVEQIISQNASVKQTIQETGLSKEAFKKMYKDMSLAQKAIQKSIKDVKVSDKEAKDYYEDNKKDYVFQKEAVRARHILLKTIDENNKQLSQKQQEKIKQKAEDILEKAKSGEDFVSLAKQYSEDPGSKDNGGEYVFTRGQMVKEFEDTAFSLEPGQISDIVKTRYGFHIIKLEEKFEKGHQKEFDMVKDKIKSELKDKKVLSKWKENSNIVKNEEVYNSI